MTETTTTETPWRQLTQADFAALAIARFGENALDWAYVCPGCGDIATAREFPPGRRDRAGLECIGRHLGAIDLEPTRGCNRVACGLIPGPWTVELPGGELARCFALAEPPHAPQNAPQAPGDTEGGVRAETPPAPRSAPARALRVERQTPGARRILAGGGIMLDPENWDYRVALGEHHSVLGYRDARPDVPVTALFVDTATGPYDWCHDLAPDMGAAKEHIEQHRLPIAEAALVLALSLIVDAHGCDIAAAKIPAPSAEFLGAAPAPRARYWTADDGWTDGIDCSCHLSAPCSRCESLQECERCGADVPQHDMRAHLDQVHAEPRPFVHDA